MTDRVQPNSFLLTLFGFEKTRSKWHILLIVLIHAAGWCLLFLLPVLLYPVRVNDQRFIIRELVDKSVLVALFYINFYWLIPRFFERKRYITYSLLAILAFFIYLLQNVAVRVRYFPRPEGPFKFIQLMGPSQERPDSLITNVMFSNTQGVNSVSSYRDSAIGTGGSFERPVLIQNRDRLNSIMPRFSLREPGVFGIPKGMWLMTLNNAISSFALLLLMGGFFRLAYSFIRNQNEKKALENANLNAEVNFLKSQINPHFLFNTLNSIYAQAHSRSDNTEFSILKLSELLRYVLYDSGENKVELTKDIQYINNYIDLQKMRLSSKVKIRYSVKGDLKGYNIAPLLLITFIENAFKHGISYTHASVINIEIDVFEETLTMLISNPVVERNSFAVGGLGLKNVTRRLDLLYPGKYLLDVHNDDYLHIVNLKLDLKND
ncbi:MAG: histidine kinase [Chitinophagaceae bacterium]|nr:histidine kinase [Chitinophagaceae bacterium]